MNGYGLEDPLPRAAKDRQLSKAAKEALKLCVLPYVAASAHTATAESQATGKSAKQPPTKLPAAWSSPGAPDPSTTERKPARPLTRHEKTLQWHKINEHGLRPEEKEDLRVLALRDTIDTTKGYKSLGWDPENPPTDVLFGTVIEGPADVYSGRYTKKQRAKSMMEEILTKDSVVYEKFKKRVSALPKAPDQKRRKRRHLPARVSGE